MLLLVSEYSLMPYQCHAEKGEGVDVGVTLSLYGSSIQSIISIERQLRVGNGGTNHDISQELTPSIHKSLHVVEPYQY